MTNNEAIANRIWMRYKNQHNKEIEFFFFPVMGFKHYKMYSDKVKNHKIFSPSWKMDLDRYDPGFKIEFVMDENWSLYFEFRKNTTTWEYRALNSLEDTADEYPWRSAPNSINGIYKLTFAATGLSYIGESQDIFKRWKYHEKSTITGKNAQHFHNELRNNPHFVSFWDDIQVEILELGDFTREERHILENQYIDKYNTLWPNGYNMRRNSIL